MTDLARRPLVIALLLGVVAEALFLHGLTRAPILFFDEVHYVPAARALLALSGPVNIEHPLLAKELIAAGIALFGDGAFGWRFLSTLAGTATVLAVFAIGRWLTGRTRPAVMAAVFAVLNFTVFVQARIAMLDGFMAAFALWGLALLLWALGRPDRFWRRWIGGAVLLGLATGCKWVALPLIAAAGAGLLVLAWRRPARIGWRRAVAAMVVLGVVSALAYLVTFAPAFFYAHDALTLATLLPFQATMFAEQTQVLPHHVYQSAWWSWPIDLRAIWYLYQPVDGVERGVLMIGNPAVLWGGLVAVAWCGWRAWRLGSLRWAAAAALWLASYAMWIVIPKSLGFFYYYYLPSVAICLPLAIALDDAGERRWGRADEWYAILCVGLFGYFYPILSAAALPGPAAFESWMWLPSWI